MADVWAYVAVLKQRRSWLRGPRVEDGISACASIADTGSPFDARHVFPFVFDAHPEIARQAARTVTALLSSVKPREWKELYAAFRCIDLDPRQVTQLTSLPPEWQVHPLGVASLNGNGYVREQALVRMEQLHAAACLPYVVLRLSDWVQPVRERAADMFRSLLTIVPLENVVHHHGLLLGLRQVERVNLGTVVDEVADLLRSAERRAELRALFRTAGVRERLFCAMMIGNDVDPDTELLDMFLTDRACEVRAWIAQRMPLGDGFNWRLRQLLHDTATRVRVAALDRLPDESFDELQDTVRDLIYDRSRSVRETARHVLNRHGTYDFRARYLERINDPGPIEPGVVAGLAETGTAEDAPAISRFLDDSRSEVRADALAGMCRLDPDATSLRAVKRLDDSSGKVRRAAMKCLFKVNDTAGRPLVRRVMREGSVPGRVAALRVLAARGGIDALEDILTALLPESDETVIRVAWQQLQRWHGKHAARGWLHKPDGVENRVGELLAHHRHLNTQPPEHARRAWEDLPHLARCC